MPRFAFLALDVLPHVVGKGVIKEIRNQYPLANIVAIDYDPGASEVNQLNRIKLMLLLCVKIAAVKAVEQKICQIRNHGFRALCF